MKLHSRVRRGRGRGGWGGREECDGREERALLHASESCGACVYGRRGGAEPPASTRQSLRRYAREARRVPPRVRGRTCTERVPTARIADSETERRQHAPTAPLLVRDGAAAARRRRCAGTLSRSVRAPRPGHARGTAALPRPGQRGGEGLDPDIRAAALEGGGGLLTRGLPPAACTRVSSPDHVAACHKACACMRNSVRACVWFEKAHLGPLGRLSQGVEGT